MNNPIEDYKKLWEWLKNPIDNHQEAYDALIEQQRKEKK